MTIGLEKKKYKCTICDNRLYASYKSLWYHNYKFHKTTPTDDTNIVSIDTNIVSTDTNIVSIDIPNVSTENENKIIVSTDKKIKFFYCKHCNKQYNHCSSKSRHEQTCANTTIITNNNNTNNINNNINNTNNINTNNTINNNQKIFINKLGNENVFDLNMNEVMDIFNKEISCITLLIEYLHFNERLPENHSFCITNLDNKYISVFNPDKQLIEKDRKKYVFDTILDNSTNKLENLFNHYKNKFSHKRQYEIKDTIIHIKKLKDSFYNEKIKKEICNKINLLSYNNKTLVKDTWDGKNKIDNSVKPVKRKITFQEDLELPPSDSDANEYESDNDSDSSGPMVLIN